MHTCSTITPQLQFQILHSGRMPQDTDLVQQDMQECLGRAYIFDTALEPSFKLIHTSSEAVTAISKFCMSIVLARLCYMISILNVTTINGCMGTHFKF